jgi:hypothetical protein
MAYPPALSLFQATKNIEMHHPVQQGRERLTKCCQSPIYAVIQSAPDQTVAKHWLNPIPRPKIWVPFKTNAEGKATLAGLLLSRVIRTPPKEKEEHMN